ncbi:MAG: HD domain-containing protein [Clostridiales bacterium]|nr:HD domain-containing protein [Clostridiales bacterium]
MRKQNEIVHGLHGFTGNDLDEGDLDELLNHFSIPLRYHSERVAVCSAIMAEYVKNPLQWAGVPAKTDLAVVAHLGGLCHDIGKLLIAPLAMDGEDYLKHPDYGVQLLEKYKGVLFSDEAETRLVLETVLCHHEQPDGGGFPNGLYSKDIPLTAGICAVANSLDHRVFSTPMLCDSSGAVFCDIKMQEGTLLYESAVECFERAWPRLIEQYRKWGYDLE